MNKKYKFLIFIGLAVFLMAAILVNFLIYTYNLSAPRIYFSSPEAGDILTFDSISTTSPYTISWNVKDLEESIAESLYIDILLVSKDCDADCLTTSKDPRYVLPIIYDLKYNKSNVPGWQGSSRLPPPRNTGGIVPIRSGVYKLVAFVDRSSDGGSKEGRLLIGETGYFQVVQTDEEWDRFLNLKQGDTLGNFKVKDVMFGIGSNKVSFVGEEVFRGTVQSRLGDVVLELSNPADYSKVPILPEYYDEPGSFCMDLDTSVVSSDELDSLVISKREVEVKVIGFNLLLRGGGGCSDRALVSEIKPL